MLRFWKQENGKEACWTFKLYKTNLGPKFLKIKPKKSQKVKNLNLKCKALRGAKNG